MGKRKGNIKRKINSKIKMSVFFAGISILLSACGGNSENSQEASVQNFAEKTVPEISWEAETSREPGENRERETIWEPEENREWEVSRQPEPLQENSDSGEEERGNLNQLNVQAGSENYTITLYENETAEALKELLPLTLDMSDLNGNEKYFYLKSALPMDAESVGSIRNGDLMLYGTDCLVLFYESFSSGFSYTRIGSIQNPEGLGAALGDGNISLTFSLKQ